MPSLFYVGGSGFLLNSLNKEDITVSIGVTGDSVWCSASWKKGKFSVSKKLPLIDLLTALNGGFENGYSQAVVLNYNRLIELTLKELEETVTSLELACHGKQSSPPAD